MLRLSNHTMRADARKNYDRLLEIAREVLAEQGADASLRDIARRAGVGLGTLYRHFPTREALLEIVLRESFDQLAAQADALGALPADDALVAWLREAVAMTHQHRGVIAAMVAAIDDPDSALHAACVGLKAAGAALLSRAQAEGRARPDLDGAALFDLVAALAWLHEQPASAPRADGLFALITGAILAGPPATKAAPTSRGRPGTRSGAVGRTGIGKGPRR